MMFRSQAELDEALRVGTVEDPTVAPAAESPEDSTPPAGADADPSLRPTAPKGEA